MNCFRCGQENPPRAKFCFECAAPLQFRSPSPEAYTPRYLAEKIRAGRGALEGERKRVSVLFADLESSMALLAGRDPEDARILLDGVLARMMEAVHRYEGTVNQIMGDGIMALFGAPAAHEDHALRACHAALRMQETMRTFSGEVIASSGAELRIRVGINSGEVLVRSIAGDLHMDYSAIGQTTHIAAKVEQMAEPGSVYATGEVMRLVEGYIEARPLEPRQVKGLADPVALFEITGPGPLRTRFDVSARRGLSRFVGRMAESAELERAGAFANQNRGQFVAVCGQPGVGKSRLIWEFTQLRRQSGWSILKASADSHGQTASYLPLIELMERYFGIDPADEMSAVAAKIGGRLAGLGMGPASHLQPLLALFDLSAPDARWDSLDPPQRHRRTLETVTALLVAESRLHPLIVLVEDLHAIDPETLELLEVLAEAMDGERFLLIVEHRPEFRHEWREGSQPVRLDIEPLPAPSAAELFRSLAGDEPDLLPLEALVLSRTEGNPLFIEESLRSLIDSGALERKPNGFRLSRPIGEVAIPATVQDILAARVDRLDDEQKSLLQMAAVIGRELPLNVLQLVARLDEASLAASLAELTAAEFIVETRPAPTPEYTFKHAFTQQVAYSSLLQNRRKALHASIMEAIESLYPGRLSEHLERLAFHAVRGEQWPCALDYLRQAARRAVERSANRDAIRHLEEAIRILPHLPHDRRATELAIDLRLELRNPLVARGSFRSIIPVLREAEAIAESYDDDARRARVAAYIAGYYWLAGQHEAAVAAGESALEKALPTGDSAVLVTTRFYIGASRHSMADYRRSMEILRQNIAAMGDANLRERYGMAGVPAVLSRCIRAWSQSELGEFEPALAETREALALAESSGHSFSVLTASFVTAVVRLSRGDLAEAIRILEQGLALSRAERMRIWYPAFAVLLAQALALSGRAADAAPMVQKALPVPTDAIYFAPFAVVAATEVYLLAGHAGESAKFGTRGLELAKRKHERGYEAWALRILGEIAARREPADRQVAEAYYRESLERAMALEMRPLAARCQLGLGMLHSQARAREQALHALGNAAGQFEEMGMAFWRERAQSALESM